MISNVGDFLNIVDELYPENGDAFFRGQSSSDFDISSSLCRLIKDCGVGMDASGLFSKRLFEKFEEKFPAYSESSFLKNYSTNEIDILMTAQHYGMPTRLIDWTANPLIALYFAAENRSDSDYMSVFLLKKSQENPLIVLSGAYFNKSMAVERRIFNELRDCFTELSKMFEQAANLHSVDLDKISGFIYKAISEIKRIPAKVALEKGIDYFSIMREKDGENLTDLANYMVQKLEEFLERYLEEGADNIVDGLMEVQVRLSNIDFNYIGELAGMNFYGNNNLIVEPLPLNGRIKNQQGFFLCSKKCHAPELEAKHFVLGKNLVRSKNDINDDVINSSIIRIDIETKFSEKIKIELARYGTKKSFVYPELASFSEEIKENISNIWKRY